MPPPAADSRSPSPTSPSSSTVLESPMTAKSLDAFFHITSRLIRKHRVLSANTVEKVDVCVDFEKLSVHAKNDPSSSSSGVMKIDLVTDVREASKLVESWSFSWKRLNQADAIFSYFDELSSLDVMFTDLEAVLCSLPFTKSMVSNSNSFDSSSIRLVPSWQSFASELSEMKYGFEVGSIVGEYRSSPSTVVEGSAKFLVQFMVEYESSQSKDVLINSTELVNKPKLPQRRAGTPVPDINDVNIAISTSHRKHLTQRENIVSTDRVPDTRLYHSKVIQKGKEQAQGIKNEKPTASSSQGMMSYGAAPLVIGKSTATTHVSTSVSSGTNSNRSSSGSGESDMTDRAPISIQTRLPPSPKWHATSPLRPSPLRTPEKSHRDDAFHRIDPSTFSHLPETLPSGASLPASGHLCSSSSNMPHSLHFGTSPRNNASKPLYGSLVGSFEESILSGRMSSLPSHPVPFKVEIGVIAIGKSSSKLRCPPHVTVPFDAYFYYADDPDSPPSPYVGVVPLSSNVDSLSGSTSSIQTIDEGAPAALTSCGYRVPERGQLQIILKNTSNTAVKLFLLRYDLSDMPNGTRTFIRQKSYLEEEQPTTASGSSPASPLRRLPGSTRKRPVLRYAIHVNFIKTAKTGKIFLAKSMRVVFANRVPDGKEKLHIVVESPPDPHRYIPLNMAKRGKPKMEVTIEEHTLENV